MKYIACIFLKEEAKEKEKSPLEGVEYQTVSSGIAFIQEYLDKGIYNFLVFGSTTNKSIEFACEKGIIRNFIKEAKTTFGTQIKIYADVGLSPYTESGHSIIMIGGEIDHDESYASARKLCLAFAKAGADYVAPCLSLHKQVEVLRQTLDENDLKDTRIMAYSAKFSSALYGPYRAAVQSPLKGEMKKTYQTDYADIDTALKQIELDQKQGADIVMVKPAMLYLDVVYRARQLTDLPLAVYHVSGEYSMIKETSKTGLLDENEAFDEVHSAFNRCGVNYVIGYAPDHFIRWNKKIIN
jgi:porphobilinogen synthase